MYCLVHVLMVRFFNILCESLHTVWSAFKQFTRRINLGGQYEDQIQDENGFIFIDSSQLKWETFI